MQMYGITKWMVSHYDIEDKVIVDNWINTIAADVMHHFVISSYGTDFILHEK